MSDEVVVVIGSGAIAQAITRRIGTSKIILLADIKAENMITVVDTLSKVGFIVHTQIVDVGDRASIQNLVSKANQLGHIVNVIHTAGLSPSQASAEAILKVDLYGTAVVLEEFGHIISKNGSAIVIGSQSSHRLDIDAISQRQAHALATSAPEELLELSFVKEITESLYAYQISKRGNALRVSAEAVKWAKRGARVNCISAGIIYTPLAYDELNSLERGEFYRKMLSSSPAGRGGTPDEIAALVEFISGSNGSYITGSDFLIDGGATAMYRYG